MKDQRRRPKTRKVKATPSQAQRIRENLEKARRNLVPTDDEPTVAVAQKRLPSISKRGKDLRLIKQRQQERQQDSVSNVEPPSLVADQGLNETAQDPATLGFPDKLADLKDRSDPDCGIVRLPSESDDDDGQRNDDDHDDDQPDFDEEAAATDTRVEDDDGKQVATIANHEEEDRSSQSGTVQTGTSAPESSHNFVSICTDEAMFDVYFSRAFSMIQKFFPGQTNGSGSVKKGNKHGGTPADEAGGVTVEPLRSHKMGLRSKVNGGGVMQKKLTPQDVSDERVFIFPWTMMIDRFFSQYEKALVFAEKFAYLKSKPVTSKPMYGNSFSVLIFPIGIPEDLANLKTDILPFGRLGNGDTNHSFFTCALDILRQAHHRKDVDVDDHLITAMKVSMRRSSSIWLVGPCSQQISNIKNKKGTVFYKYTLRVLGGATFRSSHGGSYIEFISSYRHNLNKNFVRFDGLRRSDNSATYSQTNLESAKVELFFVSVIQALSCQTNSLRRTQVYIQLDCSLSQICKFLFFGFVYEKKHMMKSRKAGMTTDNKSWNRSFPRCPEDCDDCLPRSLAGLAKVGGIYYRGTDGTETHKWNNIRLLVFKYVVRDKTTYPLLQEKTIREELTEQIPDFKFIFLFPLPAPHYECSANYTGFHNTFKSMLHETTRQHNDSTVGVVNDMVYVLNNTAGQSDIEGFPEEETLSDENEDDLQQWVLGNKKVLEHYLGEYVSFVDLPHSTFYAACLHAWYGSVHPKFTIFDIKRGIESVLMRLLWLPHTNQVFKLQYFQMLASRTDGLHRNQWNDLIGLLKDNDQDANTKIQVVVDYICRYGFPGRSKYAIPRLVFMRPTLASYNRYRTNSEDRNGFCQDGRPWGIMTRKCELLNDKIVYFLPYVDNSHYIGMSYNDVLASEADEESDNDLELQMMSRLSRSRSYQPNQISQVACFNNSNKRKWCGTIQSVNIHNKYIRKSVILTDAEMASYFEGWFIDHVRANPNQIHNVPVGSNNKRALHDTATMAQECILKDEMKSSISIQFPQGSFRTCLISSFASCLYYIGMREPAKALITILKDSAVHPSIASSTAFFVDKVNTICKGFIFKSAKDFRVFNSDSWHIPASIILVGNDGSEDHCIAVYGGFIFDSSTSHALHLSKEALDWCCGPGGFRKIKKCYVLAKRGK